MCALLPASAQIERQAETYDMTMADCLAQTFAQNPEIQRLRADVERAGGDKVVIRSRAWPQFAMQVNGGLRGSSLYTTEEFKTNGTVITTNTTSAGPQPFSTLSAQFSQPLIDIGVPAAWRRGTLEVVIAQQNLNREITERLHEVRVTFLRALYFRDLNRLYEEIDNRLRANVDSEQQRLDTGLGSDAALKRAKIQQLNLAHDLANARAEYFSALTRLADLCGRESSNPDHGSPKLLLPKPAGELEYTPETLKLSQATEYALEHRADLKLLQALVDAATAEKHIVQAGYFPLVMLTSSGLLIPENVLLSRQTAIVPGQDPRTSEVRAGVAMSWRVIDNGQVTGASRQAEAVRQQYEISLQKLKQNVPRELAAIEGALQDADARRAALAKSAEAAEENLKLIEAQVGLGQATQYDFLKAQSNLLSVRAGILDATFAHEVARAELDRATGRYLEYRPQTYQLPVTSR